MEVPFLDHGPRNFTAMVQSVKVGLTKQMSTAEYECGFSPMNLLLTSRRSSLHVTTLLSLLFLKMVGPPLEQFQPLQYVKSWLAKGHHAASDVGCKTHLLDSTALVTWL